MIKAVSNTNFYLKNSQPIILPESRTTFGQSDDEFISKTKNKKKESFFQKHWGKMLIGIGLIVIGVIVLKNKTKSFSKAKNDIPPKIEPTQKDIEALDKEIEKNPNHAINYDAIAHKHSELGNYSQAIANYIKVIEFNPKNPNPYIEIGLAYKKMEEYSKALNFYTKVIEDIDPKNHIAHFNRACLYAKMGSVENAFKDIDRAIGLNPSDKDYLATKEQILKAIKGK